MPEHNLQQTGETMLEAARAINERIDRDFDTLEIIQIHEMSNKAQELLMKSKLLFALAVIEIGEKAKKDLAELEEAKKEIAKAIKTIEKVQKVINVAAKLVIVASNILTGNFKEIPKSAQDVLKEIKK